jgi:hypothetical protein
MIKPLSRRTVTLFAAVVVLSLQTLFLTTYEGPQPTTAAPITAAAWNSAKNWTTGIPTSESVACLPRASTVKGLDITVRGIQAIGLTVENSKIGFSPVVASTASSALYFPDISAWTLRGNVTIRSNGVYAARPLTIAGTALLETGDGPQGQPSRGLNLFTDVFVGANSSLSLIGGGVEVPSINTLGNARLNLDVPVGRLSLGGTTSLRQGPDRFIRLLQAGPAAIVNVDGTVLVLNLHLNDRPTNGGPDSHLILAFGGTHLFGPCSQITLQQLTITSDVTIAGRLKVTESLRIEHGATLTLLGADAHVPMPTAQLSNSRSRNGILVNRRGLLSLYPRLQGMSYPVDIENASDATILIEGVVQGTGGDFRSHGRVVFRTGSVLSQVRGFTTSGEVDLEGNPNSATIQTRTFQGLPPGRFVVRNPVSGQILVQTHLAKPPTAFTSNVRLLQGQFDIRIW